MNIPYPYRTGCANYLCAQYGCQGHCGYRPPPNYPSYYTQPTPRGCICPAGAEKTCQGFGCPRKGIAQAIAAAPAKVSGRAKGGHARAASMTPEQRSEQARKAAKARWSASCDTQPKAGDSTQIEAPLVSGAVPSETSADAHTSAPNLQHRGE